jgi:hypothetical protein
MTASLYSVDFEKCAMTKIAKLPLNHYRAIYIAGASKEVNRAAKWMAACRKVGLTVTSTWIENIAEVAKVRTNGDFAAAANPIKASRADRVQWSDDNLRGIRSANHLWLLIPEHGVMSHGAFFEFGFAFADGTMTYASGKDHSAIFTAKADWLCETDEQAFCCVLRQFVLDEVAVEDGWHGERAEMPPWEAAVTITDEMIVALFERHCECRPVDVTRETHTHDCDTGYTDPCRMALSGLKPDHRNQRMVQRARAICVNFINAGY